MPADISILLATYNGAAYLEEQLASLTRQSLAPLEVVITDDGSRDATLAIAGAFARRAPFTVKILSRAEAVGVTENFALGLGHVGGRYVAYCDQDDVWDAEKLAVMRARLERDRSLLALHISQMTDEALAPIGVMRQGIGGDRTFGAGAIDPYLGKFAGWGNTMMFDGRLIPLLAQPRPSHPVKAERLSHDTWTYVIAAGLGRVSHVNRPLVLYRQHASNIYGVKEESAMERFAASSASPVRNFRRRAEFYRECADSFRMLDVEPAFPAAAAQRAASLYDRRAAQCDLRADIYDRQGRNARLSAFAALYRQSGGIAAFGENKGLSRVRSAVKDLALGVLKPPQPEAG